MTIRRSAERFLPVEGRERDSGGHRVDGMVELAADLIGRAGGPDRASLGQRAGRLLSLAPGGPVDDDVAAERPVRALPAVDARRRGRD